MLLCAHLFNDIKLLYGFFMGVRNNILGVEPHLSVIRAVHNSRAGYKLTSDFSFGV